MPHRTATRPHVQSRPLTATGEPKQKPKPAKKPRPPQPAKPPRVYVTTPQRPLPAGDGGCHCGACVCEKQTDLRQFILAALDDCARRPHPMQPEALLDLTADGFADRADQHGLSRWLHQLCLDRSIRSPYRDPQ